MSIPPAQGSPSPACQTLPGQNGPMGPAGPVIVPTHEGAELFCDPVGALEQVCVHIMGPAAMLQPVDALQEARCLDITWSSCFPLRGMLIALGVLP